MKIVLSRNVIHDVLTVDGVSQIVTRGEHSKMMLEELRKNGHSYSPILLLEMLKRVYLEIAESKDYVVLNPEDLPLQQLISLKEEDFEGCTIIDLPIKEAESDGGAIA